MLACHPQGVADTFAGLLHHKFGAQIGVLTPHVALDFLAQVANYKDKIFDSGGHQPVDNVSQNGIARHRHQRLRLSMGVRT